MTKSTRDMLNETIDGTAYDIAEYARQIESGEYGNKWIATCDETGAETIVLASTESEAIDTHQDDNVPAYEFTIAREEFDNPTIVDAYGNETSIDDFPLEIVDERGKDYAVVIGTGGPHIEVTASGDDSARLVGYWSSETTARHGDQFDTFLDYFIER